MTEVLAALVARILMLLSALFVFWAGGGEWGRSALSPEIPPDAAGDERGAAPSRGGMAAGAARRLFAPKKSETLIVALVLGIGAYLFLVRAGQVHAQIPERVVTWGCFSYGILFVGRAIGDFRYIGLFKAVRKTEFARLDTRLLSPLCLLIGFAAVLAALGFEIR